MRSALIWQNPDQKEGQILVEAEPLALMDQHRQDRPAKPEFGGILLGYRRGDHLHITVATPPQVNDRGGRYFFERSTRHHQEIALRQWKASGEKVDYLGEWHTHPQQLPSPSTTDIIEWQKIWRMRQQPMAFMIMGWSGEVWLGLSSAGEIKKCVTTEPQGSGKL